MHDPLPSLVAPSAAEFKLILLGGCSAYYYFAANPWQVQCTAAYIRTYARHVAAGQVAHAQAAAVALSVRVSTPDGATCEPGGIAARLVGSFAGPSQDPNQLFSILTFRDPAACYGRRLSVPDGDGDLERARSLATGRFSLACASFN